MTNESETKDEDGNQEVKTDTQEQTEKNGETVEPQAKETDAPTNGSTTTVEEKPTNGSTAVEKGERDGVPSNILEKGIIYFFFRGRVGIDEPESVEDIRRSYFVLRPIDKDAKLGEGTIGDAGNSRLIAIPK